jgi:hypothetical protein
MSFSERQAWIQAAVFTVVPGWYLLATLSQLGNTAASEIAYQWPMVWSFVVVVVAMVALIVVGTVGSVVGVAVRNAAEARARGEAAPTEVRDADVRVADRRDERDADIDRLGGYVGGIVLGVGALMPLGLAMAEREPFWIANSLYAALALSALASAVAKIVAYRRGL